MMFMTQVQCFIIGNEYTTELSYDPNLLPMNITLSNNTKEHCKTDSLDEAVQWIFYLQHPTRRIPENITDMEVFCSYKNALENNVEDYSKLCLKSLPRTITELLMFGVKRQNRYYCSGSSKARSDLLDSARCLAKIKQTGKKCMDELIVDMLSVLTSPSAKRIGRLCW